MHLLSLIDAGADKGRLHAPHVIPPNVLPAKQQLDKLESDNVPVWQPVHVRVAPVREFKMLRRRSGVRVGSGQIQS